MENKETIKDAQSKIILLNKKNLSVCGVTKFVGANKDLITIYVGKSKLQIEGKLLEIVKLDVDSGNIEISGEVTAMQFDKQEKNFLKRVFK